MRNFTFFAGIILAFLSASCSVDIDDTQEVLSTWRLIETRISEGGEASFVPTEIDEVITFYTNSKIMRNTAWCTDSDNFFADYSLDGEIFTSCSATASLNFVIDGDIMILSNPSCIEVCEYKYMLEESNPVLGIY